jgi:hypothetical protein
MRQRLSTRISEHGYIIAIIFLGQIIVLGSALLLVSLLVEGLRGRLRPEERRRAQLEGVQLAAGEVADRFGNSLAVAACTMEEVGMFAPSRPSSGGSSAGPGPGSAMPIMTSTSCSGCGASRPERPRWGRYWIWTGQPSNARPTRSGQAGASARPPSTIHRNVWPGRAWSDESGSASRLGNAP